MLMRASATLQAGADEIQAEAILAFRSINAIALSAGIEPTKLKLEVGKLRGEAVGG